MEPRYRTVLSHDTCELGKLRLMDAEALLTAPPFATAVTARLPIEILAIGLFSQSTTTLPISSTRGAVVVLLGGIGRDRNTVGAVGNVSDLRTSAGDGKGCSTREGVGKSGRDKCSKNAGGCNKRELHGDD